MYESTLLIFPRYSISFFNLTATRRFIDRWSADSGLFGWCCEGDDDNSIIPCKNQNIVATIKIFAYMGLLKSYPKFDYHILDNDSAVGQDVKVYPRCNKRY
jgi:hypothetical protein